MLSKDTSKLIDYRQTDEETVLASAFMRRLGEIRIAQPPNTFAVTPASLIALEAIARNKQLLSGRGLDWGSGTGCLAIAAARIPTVEQVIGLEIAEENVAVARRNAISNGVGDKTTFLLADSYSPIAPGDRSLLDAFAGQTDFILANPPASDGDDGFGWRRRVLSGARDFLRGGGHVFLNVSSQYGGRRLDTLCARGIALLRLETGIHQAAAVHLYERLGFRRIPPFGDYTEDPLSLFYEKRIA